MNSSSDTWSWWILSRVSSTLPMSRSNRWRKSLATHMSEVASSGRAFRLASLIRFLALWVDMVSSHLTPGLRSLCKTQNRVTNKQ